MTTLLHTIDYPLLREQKQILLTLMDYLADPDSRALSGHPMSRGDALDGLTGILHLLDDVQDAAVHFQIAAPYEVYATEDTCVFCKLMVFDQGDAVVDTEGSDQCPKLMDNGTFHAHCRGFAPDVAGPNPDVCIECLCHLADHPDQQEN